MNVNYRVRAGPADGGDDFIMELFESLSDAQQFYKELQDDSDGNVLAAMPFDTVRISMEEFVNGTWTYMSRKVVSLR